MEFTPMEDSSLADRNLPVEGPSKFQFGINRRTAKALGLTLSPALVARANAVIE